jgi:hypothetical protein
MMGGGRWEDTVVGTFAGAAASSGGTAFSADTAFSGDEAEGWVITD